MRKFLALSFALLAVNVFAGEKEELAGEMLTLVGTPKMVQQYQDRMKMMLAGALKRFETSPAAKAKAAEVIKSGNELIMKSFNWDGVKGDLIKEYSAAFSTEELKAVISFYKSPAGKKLLEKSPALMRSSMQIVQKKCMSLLPKVKKMVDEVKATSTPSKTACSATSGKPGCAVGSAKTACAAGPVKTACAGGKCSTKKCGTNCDPKTSKCPAGVCPAKK